MKIRLLIASFFLAAISFAQTPRPEKKSVTRKGNEIVVTVDTIGVYAGLINPSKIPTGSGSSGDVISWSANALSIASDGADQTDTIQLLYNSGIRFVWFNNPSGANYTINGTLNIPGMFFRFEPNNKFINASLTGTGTLTASQYSQTVTGSGTSFLTQQKADYLLYVGGVYVGWIKSIESNTSLTLRVPTRTALTAQAFTYRGGVIREAMIDANYEQQICTPYITLDCYSTTNNNSVKWYGAVGDDVTDDYLPMQKAINDAVFFRKLANVKVPNGKYAISKGLFFRSGNTGDTHPYTQVGMQGFGGCHDANLGGSALIRLTTNKGFCIGVQRGKSNLFENLELEGQNLIDYNFYETISDTSTFQVNGISTGNQDAYTGFAIDPVGNAAITTENRYEGFEEYYNDLSAAGSTVIQGRRMKVQHFFINYGVSVNGYTQNAEGCSFYQCWSGYSLVGFGNYNSQAVTNQILDCYVWNSTKFAIDCAFADGTSYLQGGGFGQGGQSFEVEGLNVARVQWICRLPSSFGTSRINGVRSELTLGVGGVFNPVTAGASHLIMERLDFRLSGSHAEESNARTNMIFAQVQHLTLRDSRIVTQGLAANQINISAMSVFLDNVILPLNEGLGYAGSQIYQLMCDYQTADNRFTGSTNNNQYVTQTSVTSSTTVTSVSEALAQWTYVAANTDNIEVGDAVSVYSTAMQNEFKSTTLSNYIIYVGFVEAVNTTTKVVTVGKLTYGITNGLTLNTVYTSDKVDL